MKLILFFLKLLPISQTLLELLLLLQLSRYSLEKNIWFLPFFLLCLVNYQILSFLGNVSSLFKWPPLPDPAPPPLLPAMCILEAVARSFFHKSHFHHFTCYSKFSVAFHKLQHKIKNICLSSLPFLTGSHSHFICQLLLFCVLWELAAIMWLPCFLSSKLVLHLHTESSDLQDLRFYIQRIQFLNDPTWIFLPRYLPLDWENRMLEIANSDTKSSVLHLTVSWYQLESKAPWDRNSLLNFSRFVSTVLQRTPVLSTWFGDIRMTRPWTLPSRRS